MILVSRLDYRKLWPLSPYIYLITLVIWLYALISGPTVAGLPYLLIGPWAINLGAVTPYFLIAASAGLLLKCDWNDRKSYLISGALFIIPLMLYLASSCLSGLLLFGGAFLVLVWRSGGKKLHISCMLYPYTAVLKILPNLPTGAYYRFLNPQAIRWCRIPVPAAGPGYKICRPLGPWIQSFRPAGITYRFCLCLYRL